MHKLPRPAVAFISILAVFSLPQAVGAAENTFQLKVSAGDMDRQESVASFALPRGVSGSSTIFPRTTSIITGFGFRGQIGSWEITPGKPYVSRYRFIAFDGPADKAELDRFWQDYAQPVAVHLE